MFSVQLLATANEQIRPLDHRTEQETWAILAHLRYRSTNLQSCEFVESDPRIAVTHRRSASNGEIVRQLRRWRIGARTLQDVSAEQYTSIVDTQI